MKQSKDVFIRDEKSFEKKISILKKDGARSLHIISDFDKTITLESCNGNKHSLSFQPMTESIFAKGGREKSDELFREYGTKEKDSTIPLEERSRLMAEWWRKHFELAISYRITESELFDVASKLGLPFREKTKEFFTALEKKQVPVLVFSAGLKNAIEYYFKRFEVQSENIHIIANEFTFKDGTMNGFKVPQIHAFNKDERHVKDTNYATTIKKRKNVILLGDSTGDLTMANGMDHNCILTIGFLNNEIEKNLTEYSSKFDAVILNDGTFEFVNELLNEIL